MARGAYSEWLASVYASAACQPPGQCRKPGGWRPAARTARLAGRLADLGLAFIAEFNPGNQTFVGQGAAAFSATTLGKRHHPAGFVVVSRGWRRGWRSRRQPGAQAPLIFRGIGGNAARFAIRAGLAIFHPARALAAPPAQSVVVLTALVCGMPCSHHSNPRATSVGIPGARKRAGAGTHPQRRCNPGNAG